jgi:hypothetical protein
LSSINHPLILTGCPLLAPPNQEAKILNTLNQHRGKQNCFEDDGVDSESPMFASLAGQWKLLRNLFLGESIARKTRHLAARLDAFKRVLLMQTQAAQGRNGQQTAKSTHAHDCRFP